MIPYAGVSFLTYDTLKQVFSTDPLLIPYTTVRTSPSPSTTRSTSIDDDTNSLPPPPRPKLRSWALLTCGAISGAIAQTSSYPFEIVRRNMQVAGLLHSNSSVSSTPTTPTTTTTTPFHSTLSTAKYIYNQRGLRGFFVGLSIGYLKVTPMFAISFYVYELMKGKLEID